METSKDFLDKKVTPVMEPMMIELLLHKPEDPVSFMIQHLSGIVGQKEGKIKISLRRKEEAASARKEEGQKESNQPFLMK
jgi:hypothetical protein